MNEKIKISVLLETNTQIVLEGEGVKMAEGFVNILIDQRTGKGVAYNSKIVRSVIIGDVEPTSVKEY